MSIRCVFIPFLYVMFSVNPALKEDDQELLKLQQTPLELGLESQKIFRSVGVFCHGFLAGLASWQLFMVSSCLHDYELLSTLSSAPCRSTPWQMQKTSLWTSSTCTLRLHSHSTSCSTFSLSFALFPSWTGCDNLAKYLKDMVMVST